MTMTADELRRSTELEKTKRMLSNLTDWQIQAVQMFIKDFITTPTEDSPFRPLSEEELIERIERGIAQGKRGEYQDAEEFEAQMMEKYGLK